MTAPDSSAINRLLEESRRNLKRVDPLDLETVMASGALIVDIRPLEQRDRYGELPGAVVIDRNVLEWRLDPSSPHRLAAADDPERVIVIVCQEGYSSSLAARTLQQIGLINATDLCGGFQALQAAAAVPGGQREHTASSPISSQMSGMPPPGTPVSPGGGVAPNHGPLPLHGAS